VSLLRRIADVVAPKDERRVLLVEDNPEEARALAAALEQAGFGVTHAASVGEALPHVDGGGRLLAAIVDMKLPDASGGLVVWQLRRRFGSDVPVAVVTGMHGAASEFNVARHPPDRLFPKPLDVEELLAWVTEVRSGAAKG
jgi:DNA-binding response OmpR family regulator